MLERTFSIIKPDAVKRNLIGEILSRLEQNGLKVVASKMVFLTRGEAEGFYAEHEGKPFYETLVNNMTAGPIIVQVLEGEDAIAKNRQVMGTTDPEKADAGTIRKDFAVSMQQNSVHGSDSPASAAREISYFFSEIEIFSGN
ncbi:nucleoside-diphosphate kinase [Hydrogenovibrio thermophilus]|uniref:Nucleoside diphosphate kinase n=1 Tax=Hydrogenovibrio thermophilus TaxID=265883 RepID=A0A410H1R0_9GAMM|nr:nucleoside-diphosphate kinase [Hydrogenovibrio thermophilus]QAB14849.1 nucleoside-diphosphate kinase [Hydrogenovibrio thermophilus]